MNEGSEDDFEEVNLHVSHDSAAQESYSDAPMAAETAGACPVLRDPVHDGDEISEVGIV